MEGCLVGGGEFAQTGFNGGVKVGVVGVVARVEGLLLHKHPEPLDEVQVGGVRRQEEQLDPQRPGLVSHQRTALVGRVVEYRCDRCRQSRFQVRL